MPKNKPKKVIDLRTKAPGRSSPMRSAPPAAPTRSSPSARAASAQAPEPSPKKARRPLREVRRRARAVTVLGISLACIMLAGLVSYISYAPSLNIAHIQVDGATHIIADDVILYTQSVLDAGGMHYLSRKNIFLYPRAVVEQDVANDFPRIASVKVGRPSLWSTTLTVHITERTPFARWCADESACYDMDERGFIFAESATSTAYDTPSHYLFYGGVATSSEPSGPIGQSFSGAHMPGILAFLHLLETSGFSPTGAIAENDTDFTVPLADRTSIKASFGQSSSDIVHNLRLVLMSDALRDKAGDIDYVDLRFGDKVYYKLKSDVKSSIASSTKSR